MVEDDRYRIDILTQVGAAQAALGKVDPIYAGSLKNVVLQEQFLGLVFAISQGPPTLGPFFYRMAPADEF